MLGRALRHTHAEPSDRDPLITCEVCGRATGLTTCTPLVVGGEVIGSVLAVHPRAMAIAEAQSLKKSVTQATPALANLRNLAIAEGRAKTDALSVLPNKRNVADNIKRMVVHASRTVSPLAALALDLDHFKQINDRYGHSTGDEVLAAGLRREPALRASTPSSCRPRSAATGTVKQSLGNRQRAKPLDG